MTSRTGTGSLAADAADAFRDYLAGDTGRMADLVSLLTKPLWATARSSGLSASQAEDVVQGAWVRLVQGADSIRDPQAVFGWLLTTVRRDSWRAAGRPSYDELPDEPPSTTNGPEAILEEADTARVLWLHVTVLTRAARPCCAWWPSPPSPTTPPSRRPSACRSARSAPPAAGVSRRCAPR